MTTRLDDNRVDTIEISEVGSVLTKIESFCIKPQVGYCWMSIGSFSPTTYRISVSVHCDRVLILDVRNSEQLLEGEGHYGSHSFSPDGNLFAIWSLSRVNIWKYTSSRYTPWRELPIKCSISDTSPLQFSPTSSSVLVSPSRIPQVWRLDGPPTVARPQQPHTACCTFSLWHLYRNLVSGGQYNHYHRPPSTNYSPLHRHRHGDICAGLHR